MTKRHGVKDFPESFPLQVLEYESTAGGWSTLLDIMNDRTLDGQVLHKGTRIDFSAQIDAYRYYLGDKAAGALEVAAKVTNFEIISWHRFLENVILFAEEIAKRALSLPAGHSIAFVLNPISYSVLVSVIKSDTWLFLLIAKQLVKHPSWTDINTRILLARYPMLTHNENDPSSYYKPNDKLHIILTDDMVYSGSQMSNMAYRLTQLGSQHPDVIASITIRPLFASIVGVKLIRSNIRDAIKDDDTNNPLRVVPVVKPFTTLKGTSEGERSGILKKLVDADVGVCISMDRHDGRATYIISILEAVGLIEYVTGNDKARTKPVLIGINKIFEHKLADNVSLPTTALLYGKTVRSTMAKACTWAVCDGTIPDGAQVFVDQYKNILKKLSSTKQFSPWSFKLVITDEWKPSKTSELVNVRKHKRLRDMPMRLPLLSPPNACDDKIAQINRGIDKDWNLHSNIYKSKCENPMYKQKILEKIKRLPKGSDVRSFFIQKGHE